MKYSGAIKNLLDQASKVKSIDEIRKSFKKISDNMIGLSIDLKPFGKPLFIQHCPMANSNKGADWLSLSKEIKNPYFGEAMLTCGEVTREIK